MASLRLILPVVVVALVAGAAWALFDSDSSGGERGASIDEIVGAPGEWAGERVRVTGRVISVYAGAFTVGTPHAELLVLPAKDGGAGPDVGPSDLGVRLRVTGIVRRFDEQTELVPGEENEPREGDAVLRATTIERAATGATATATATAR